MGEELKPCPFCGGKAYHQVDGITRAWQVVCMMCRAKSISHPLKQEAIKAWNTRADIAEAKLAKAVEALEEIKRRLYKGVPSQAQIDEGNCPDDIEYRVYFNEGIDAAINHLSTQGHLAPQVEAKLAKAVEALEIITHYEAGEGGDYFFECSSWKIPEEYGSCGTAQQVAKQTLKEIKDEL